MNAGRIPPALVRSFVEAGAARFTIRNVRTGGRYTYRVRSKARLDGRGTIRFVAVLSGESNETDYSYIGFVRDGRFFHGGSQSRATAEAGSVVAFGWFWAHVDALPPALEVWHEGRCGRCGRTLTVPESVEAGIGPECAGRLARAS